MKKILFISNYPRKINNFVIPSIEAAHKLEYEFHYAANMKLFNDDASKYNIILHHLDLCRFPFNVKNIKAYHELNDLLRKEMFDVIHCNTPIGGILGRMCGKRAITKKIIYTAHGFHFYDGAALLNNTVFKWAEMYMAQYTDAIITINNEDYKSAKKLKLRNDGQVYFLKGVGIDTKEFLNAFACKEKLRNSLNLKNDDIVLISAGDLIKRKNYKTSIKSIAKLNNKKIKLIICGEGPEIKNLQKLIKKTETEDQIQLLGYRNDVKELLYISDIYLFTSFQEGLPRSLMEAMAAGLPAVCSRVRGNVDLIEHGKGGFLSEPRDADGFAKAINLLAQNDRLRKEMGLINSENIKDYDVENIKKEMLKIYSSILMM